MSELVPVKHEDVEPLYSKEEILNKLASVVKAGRDDHRLDRSQQLEFELLYSIAKAFL